MSLKILQVTGRMYSGKDYFSKRLLGYLSERGASVWKTAFAWKLKQLVKDYFWYTKAGPLPEKKAAIMNDLAFRRIDCGDKLLEIHEELYSYKKDSLEFPPEVFDPIVEIIEGCESGKYMENEAGRLILQRFGTEVVRNHFNESFWVDYIAKKIGFIADAADFLILSDLRYPNEGLPGAMIIKMVMPDPMRAIHSKLSMDKLAEFAKHPSEISIDDIKADFTINNTGTMEDFLPEIKMILGE